MHPGTLYLKQALLDRVNVMWAKRSGQDSHKHSQGTPTGIHEYRSSQPFVMHFLSTSGPGAIGLLLCSWPVHHLRSKEQIPQGQTCWVICTADCGAMKIVSSWRDTSLQGRDKAEVFHPSGLFLLQQQISAVPTQPRINLAKWSISHDFAGVERNKRNCLFK